MFDTHNHCEFSCDSKMTLQQAADTAAKLGIGIILTEHWDYEYPTNPEQFLFDRDAYFKKNLPLRSDNVLLGIEVGMQPHLAEKEDKVPEGYPFDFVIGSIHMMNRLDLYEVTTYKGLSKEETMHDFLRDSIRSAESHNAFVPRKVITTLMLSGILITSAGTGPMRIRNFIWKKTSRSGTGCLRF